MAIDKSRKRKQDTEQQHIEVTEELPVVTTDTSTAVAESDPNHIVVSSVETPANLLELPAALQEIANNLANMTPDQRALLDAIQNVDAMGLLHGFNRPAMKRRKPVKWEAWEEKNLIEGVRRVFDLVWVAYWNVC